MEYFIAAAKFIGLLSAFVFLMPFAYNLFNSWGERLSWKEVAIIGVRQTIPFTLMVTALLFFFDLFF